MPKQSRKLGAGDRVVDGLFAVHILLAVWQGFVLQKSPWGGRGSQPELLMAQSMIVGFLAIFFPFRIHTRLLWILLMPFALYGAISVGFDVGDRLTHAPGYFQEMPRLVGSLSMLGILGFLAPLPLWMVLGTFGWELHQESGPSRQRTMELRELFALTCIICVLMVLFRADALLTGLLQVRMIGNPTPVGLVLLYGLPFLPCLWMGFRGHIAFALLKCTGWLCFCAAMIPIVQVQLLGVFQPASYLTVLRQYTPSIGLLLATIFAARMCGYQLIRKATAKPPDTSAAESHMSG